MGIFGFAYDTSYVVTDYREGELCAVTGGTIVPDGSQNLGNTFECLLLSSEGSVIQVRDCKSALLSQSNPSHPSSMDLLSF